MLGQQAIAKPALEGWCASSQGLLNLLVWLEQAIVALGPELDERDRCSRSDVKWCAAQLKT